MKHALLVAASLLATTSGLISQRIVAHLEWEPGTIGSSAPKRVTLGDKPPAGVRLPGGISKPHYGTIALADGQLAVVLDANPGNPRLWVDRDFDGDLSDEKTTRLTHSGSSFTRSQYVLAPFDGESEPQPLQLQWSCRVSSGKPSLSMRVLVHRRGTVVLGGRLRLVVATDGNGDGRFDDAKTDHIYLDDDGDGRLQTGSINSERIVPKKPFRIGGEGWSARVASTSGRALEFTRSKAVPDARPRTWPARSYRAAGTELTPPKESLATLLERAAEQQSAPYSTRSSTISLIGRIGTANAFDALVKLASKEKDRSARSAMLRALGNPAFLADRGDRLAALARKADTATAYSIAQALYSAAHPERDRIYIEMMASGGSSHVSAAARWLAYGGTEQARKAITKAVTSDNKPANRNAAYSQGARNLPSGPPTELVLQAARDDYAMLQAEAIRDLGVLGHPDAVRLALKAADKRPVGRSVGTALCTVLGQAGTPDAVRAMLAMLDDVKLNANVRKAIVEQLRCLRAPNSIDVLVKALGSKQAAIRAAAAETLAALPERPITNALLKRTKKERDEQVLPVLLEALGDHGDPVALSTLLKATRSGQPAVRTAAVRGLARLGFEHDKVRKLFLSMLQSRSWADRVLALDAARETHDAKLLPKIVKSLDHEQWQVRLAAIEALQSLRSRDGVLPLIDRLEEEQEQRVRDLIARTLFELTGVNAYDNVKTWRLWWSENGKDFTVPDEIPQLPDRSAGGTAAGFYGIPIVSERVVFLIDQSGSMSAVGQEAESYRDEPLDRLDVAVRETLGALKKLGDRARVNVVMFHSTIHPWKDQLQKLGSNRKSIERELESKRPTGGTNIYDALELALQMEDVDTIFLLSDGSPGRGKYVAPQEILRAIRRENQTRRIAIHCVSIGMDSGLLRKLAAENGGRYVRR